jgi:hypothetical protein
MEWYESLFLQICTHALSRARVADLRRQDRKLNLELNQAHEIVASYRKGVALVFSLVRRSNFFCGPFLWLGRVAQGPPYSSGRRQSTSRFRLSLIFTPPT